MTMPNTFQSSQAPQPANPVLVDAPGRRLGWALLVSLIGNLLLWRGVAAMARQPMRSDVKPVEITRVILAPETKRVQKIIPKKLIQKKIEKKIVPVRKEIVSPKPIVRPHIVTPKRLIEPPQQAKRPIPPPKSQPLPPPPTAHNHIITAPETKAAPTPKDHIVQSGGNADVGKPLNQQGTGDAKTNPDTIVKKETSKPPDIPHPPDVPKPVKVETPALPAGNDKKDVPAPSPPKPDPPKLPDPPRKKGPTKEAEPVNQVNPNIPDELKKGDFKSFVRVAVDIDADGSFMVTLRTSSGNQDIDNRVLEALKRWKWKPALKNGEPIQSVQRFKFEFEVQ